MENIHDQSNIAATFRSPWLWGFIAAVALTCIAMVPALSLQVGAFSRTGVSQ